MIPHAPTFPPELCDMVIDYLYDNEPALEACSLVCRAWLQSTRYHLFHTVRTRESIEGRGASNLSRILSKRHAKGILPNIHELRILASDSAARTELRPPIYSPKVSTQDVVRLISQLPRLQTVEICGVVLDGRYCNRGKSVTPISLDTLRLDRICCRNNLVDDLLSILRPFSDIQHLEVKTIKSSYWYLEESETRVEETLNKVSQVLPPHLRVQTLVVRNCTLGCLLLCDIMRKTPSVQTLQRLDLRIECLGDITALGALIKATGANFRTLCLDISSLNWSADVFDWKKLNLTDCPSLEAIHGMYVGPKFFHNTSTSYLNLLCTVNPSSLSLLTFRFRVNNSLSDLKVVDWKRMEMVLSRFRKLEMVGLCVQDNRIPPQNEMVECWQLLKRLLPGRVQRGVLNFQYSSPVVATDHWVPL
ncbi:hypothetical protein BKA93DRAFT_353108 [Sparassis latifolia]